MWLLRTVRGRGMMCNMTRTMMLTMYRTLGEALTATIRERGGTQREHAAQLEVDPAVYSRWKSGRQVPLDDKGRVIATYLDMPLSEVYTLLAVSRQEVGRPAAGGSNILDDVVAELRADQAVMRELIDRVNALLEQQEPHPPAQSPPTHKPSATSQRRRKPPTPRPRGR